MDANARLTTLTRIGFAARGLLYIVIALLVITTGRAEDPSGALQYLGQGGGRVLLIIMAAGLMAYSLWRLSDAAFDIEHHGSDMKGSAKRAGAAASGLVHLLLAWQSVKLIQGVSSSGGGAREASDVALQVPGGSWLLVVAGIVLLGVGVAQFVKAFKATFLRHLDPQIARQPWAKWSGRAGYTARGLVFLISSYFFVQAGLQEESSRAGGMAQALSWLSSPLDVLVAIGLFAFGLFSLIEARFRVLRDAPVDGLMQQAKSRLQI